MIVNSNKGGFTMIEILVVITIIGFLASAAMLSYNLARMGARDARRGADMAQLKKALSIYKEENDGKFPPGLPVGVNVAQCLTITSTVSVALANAGIMATSSLPLDPVPAWRTVLPQVRPLGYAAGASNNYCYFYWTSANRSYYYLSYYLETDSSAGKKGINWFLGQ